MKSSEARGAEASWLQQVERLGQDRDSSGNRTLYLLEYACASLVGVIAGVEQRDQRAGVD